jgi:hypothetical protein
MVVLNILGSFENPWKNDPMEESKIISEKSWHPGTDTWEAVMGRANFITVKGLGQFLGAVKQQRPRTIERINLFSHGKFGLLAFSGKIVPKNVLLDQKNALDLEIANLRPTETSEETTESMGTVARCLQDRFTRAKWEGKDAEIVLYLCNSGSDPELLQVIANTFHVVARGFSHEIWCCVEWNLGPGPRRIDRGFTSDGLTSDSDKCKNKRRGFAQLKPDRIAKPNDSAGR